MYYGTVGVEIAAIVRHWHDPFRAGLLRVNDVARLMDLLLSADRTLVRPATRRTLIDLLEEHGRTLAECGEIGLARQVGNLVKALEHLGKEPTG